VNIPEDFQYVTEPITEVEGIQEGVHEPSQEMETEVVVDETAAGVEGVVTTQVE